MFGRHTTRDMVTEEVDPTVRTGVRTRALGDTLTYDGDEKLDFDVEGKMGRGGKDMHERKHDEKWSLRPSLRILMIRFDTFGFTFDRIVRASSCVLVKFIVYGTEILTNISPWLR
jgi:hypothetical protein